MALNQSEIYTLARGVGLTDSRAKVAAAVAMAESGGNPNAHNDNAATGDDSYGLWQINMLGAMGPERRRKLGLSANSELYNPQTNAKAMAMISQTGGNFSPWSVYTSGEYLKHLQNPVEDKSGDPSWLSKLGGAVSPILGVTDTASSVAGAVEMLGKAALWVSNPTNWLRIAYVGGGLVIVGIGVYSIIGSPGARVLNSKTGRAVVRAATKGK
jgi:hypothetical protein